MNSSQTTFDSADVPGSASAVSARRQPRRLRVFILWTLIFVAGIIIGAASSVAYTRHVLLPQVITGTGRFEPEKATTRVSGRLSHDLNLDDEQSKKVREVVRSHFGRMHAFRVELRPRFEEEMQRFRSEMSDVLTEEQFAEWEQHLDHLKREFFPHQPRGRRGAHGGRGRGRHHKGEHDAHRDDHHHRGGGRRGGPPHADAHHGHGKNHGGDKPRGRGRRGDDSHADDSHSEKSGDSRNSDSDHGESDPSETSKPKTEETPESKSAKEDKTQADVEPKTE